jgi:hypothetical protein
MDNFFMIISGRSLQELEELLFKLQHQAGAASEPSSNMFKLDNFFMIVLRIISSLQEIISLLGT